MEMNKNKRAKTRDVSSMPPSMSTNSLSSSLATGNVISEPANPPSTIESADTNRVISTPIGTLMRIEATLLMFVSRSGTNPTRQHTSNDKNDHAGIMSDVKGSVTFQRFFQLAETHQWVGMAASTSFDPSGTVSSKPTSDNDILPPTTPMRKELYEVTNQLTEEERLLFDLVAVAGWSPSNSPIDCSRKEGNSSKSGRDGFVPGLYPLYRLSSSKNNGQEAGTNQMDVLEVLSPLPPSSAPMSPKKRAKNNTHSRIDVLKHLFHFSRKIGFTERGNNYHEDDGGNVECFDTSSLIQHWLENALFVGRAIIRNRKYAPSVDKNPSSNTSQTFKIPSIATEADAEIGPNNKMTLEERVRARSDFLNRSILKITSSNQSAGNPKSVYKRHKESIALLDLADALRSYSMKSGLSRPNSFLDVSSRNKSGSSTSISETAGRGLSTNRENSTSYTARLGVMDLIKDARTTWRSVLKDSISSGGNGSNTIAGSSTIYSPVVNIDLRRVLFQYRLGMLSGSENEGPTQTTHDAGTNDVSPRRLMESYLLELLKKLENLVPEWIQIISIPTTSAAVHSKQNAIPNDRIDRHNSIIIIKNNSVNYANIRSKLRELSNENKNALLKSSDSSNSSEVIKN